MAPYQPECRVLDQRTDDSECNRTLWKRGAIEMFPLWDFVVENRKLFQYMCAAGYGSIETAESAKFS